MFRNAISVRGSQIYAPYTADFILLKPLIISAENMAAIIVKLLMYAILSDNCLLCRNYGNLGTYNIRPAESG